VKPEQIITEAFARVRRLGCVCEPAAWYVVESDDDTYEVGIAHDPWCPFLRAEEGPEAVEDRAT
jgi:hypothetical protein